MQSQQPRDIDIAHAANLIKISDFASKFGIQEDEIDLYGKYCAKVNLGILNRLKDAPDGRYVVVTGITPTPLGEGKTTMTMGLTQALGAHLDQRVFACIRQPSQGPTFGIKGGAAGGGYAQAVPMEAINLHLTGDIHAVTAANNLLAAAIDARILHEKETPSDQVLFDRLCPIKKGKRKFSAVMLRRLAKLGITKADPAELTPDEMRRFVRLDVDPASISWSRVVDTNDRFLRKITIGQGPQEHGLERQTQFDIAVASEVMAVLALTTSLQDMRDRMGRIVWGQNRSGEPLTADDLGVGGAMTVLMREAINPNLLQSLERTPVFVHAGPFNIAHGSSVVADRIALAGRQDGYVLTEAGFGADIGFEKFADIKCRASGCALGRRHRGHRPNVVAGQPLNEAYTRENLDLLRAGLCNLQRHVENIRKSGLPSPRLPRPLVPIWHDLRTHMFGVPVVVGINQFETDSPAELELLATQARTFGAFDAVVTNHHSQGGAGAVPLARALMAACTSRPDPHDFRLLYPSEGMPIKEKIETIAREIYRAGSVTFEPQAEAKLAHYMQMGFDMRCVCMAKTQYSFSANPAAKGAPSGFVLPIRDVRPYAGAGFLTCLVGDMMMIPGLPSRPAFFDIDIDPVTGQIVGLN
ncbi:putative Formate--tetrahydrofolate ligase [Paratrimastix pyriformis]|uniref:formate--tetrahydrofolate ligase n=1 Tax=Paratrimastix pyriformis TaxID=342808 RepID=A0ABQ8UMU2_9EUKA|nr:putative Formate--tetrahydrofolate ligase [Paratrimastix pyriformis]